MAVLDLSTISFRSYNQGIDNAPGSLTAHGSPTAKINLSSIKYRAKAASGTTIIGGYPNYDLFDASNSYAIIVPGTPTLSVTPVTNSTGSAPPPSIAFSIESSYTATIFSEPFETNLNGWEIMGGEDDTFITTERNNGGNSSLKIITGDVDQAWLRNMNVPDISTFGVWHYLTLDLFYENTTLLDSSAWWPFIAGFVPSSTNTPSDTYYGFWVAPSGPTTGSIQFAIGGGYQSASPDITINTWNTITFGLRVNSDDTYNIRVIVNGTDSGILTSNAGQAIGSISGIFLGDDGWGTDFTVDPYFIDNFSYSRGGAANAYANALVIKPSIMTGTPDAPAANARASVKTPTPSISVTSVGTATATGSAPVITISATSPAAISTADITAPVASISVAAQSTASTTSEAPTPSISVSSVAVASASIVAPEILGDFSAVAPAATSTASVASQIPVVSVTSVAVSTASASAPVISATGGTTVVSPPAIATASVVSQIIIISVSAIGSASASVVAPVITTGIQNQLSFPEDMIDPLWAGNLSGQSFDDIIQSN